MSRSDMAVVVSYVSVEFAFDAAEDPLNLGVVVVVLLLGRLDEGDDYRETAGDDGDDDAGGHFIHLLVGASSQTPAIGRIRRGSFHG